MIKKVFIFGFGYTARYFSSLLVANNYEVYGTARNQQLRQDAKEYGVILCDFDYESIKPLLDQSQAVLICIPPNQDSVDPVFDNFKSSIISNKNNIEWLGYLSTTGVYGDHVGNWVTEEAECLNPGERAQRRITAEKNWMCLYKDYNIPVHIFRLAGIYGIGRSSLDQLRAGKNYSVFKSGQFFSRIHVEDIAVILFASINKPTPGEIYNLCDDCPSSSQEVDDFAANLLGMSKLPVIPYEDANLSPMALEFYQSNRKVSNAKVKKELSIELLYPSYKEGLKNIYDKHIKEISI